jgi:hyaluronate lyase
LELTEKGDGFYRDGSFVQHSYVPYTGSYGAVALADFSRLVTLLSGSAWPITDSNLSNVFLWARDSYAPWLIDGAMPDAVRGRKIATPSQTEHSVGRSMIAYLAVLAESAPSADAVALRSVIKGQMARDRSFGAQYLAAPSGVGTSGLSLYELGLLKKIAADPAIVAAPQPQGARLFASMDRVILRGDGYAAVVSMSSPRMSSFESGNGENLRGWWTGMGMLSLYTADQKQFGGEFWATVDSLRLPGTTTDRSDGGRPEAWKICEHRELGRRHHARQLRGAGHGVQPARSDRFPAARQEVVVPAGRPDLGAGADISDGQGAVETVVENRN